MIELHSLAGNCEPEPDPELEPEPEAESRPGGVVSISKPEPEPEPEIEEHLPHSAQSRSACVSDLQNLALLWSAA